MSGKAPRRPGQSESHHQQTEIRLVLGGFLITLVVGGFLIWIFLGLVPALIAGSIIIGAGLVFMLLLLLLRALDAWARSE